MRRQVGDAVARVLAVALIIGATSSAIPARAGAGPGTAEALLVGDSVLNGLAQGYSAAGRAALAARHSFILDAAGCRRLITTSCSIPPHAAPTNAISEVRRWAGQYDRALVVAAGYDDPSDGPYGIAAAVDTMVAEAGRQGIGHVVWLTYREAGAAGDVARFRASNAVLRSLQTTYPELLLADWAGRSAGLPTAWFSADGIHLGAQAAAEMADLIGDALDQLPTVPTRCTSGVWSGVAPDTSSDGAAAVHGGVRLLAAPARFVDTRPLAGPLGAGRVLRVPIAGVGDVPSEAVAAVVSVTAVEPCADTFLTAFPCGTLVPTASIVNARAGSIVANSGVVRLGAGALCVYTLQPTDVVVDVSGWLGPDGAGSSPMTPVRLVDTRPGLGQALPIAQHRLRAGQLLTVAAGSAAGVGPTTTAVTVDVAAAGPSSSGFLSVLPGPCSTVALPPTTSTLNVTAGRDVAAAATVGLGNGELCIFTTTDTDVVVDLQAVHSGTTGAVIATDPQRILDTRDTGRLGPGQSLAVAIPAGAPAASAAIVDLTAVDPSSNGFLTLSPCADTVPSTANVTYVAGDVVANRAVVSTGGTGRFCVYSSAATDVVIDLEGYVGAG